MAVQPEALAAVAEAAAVAAVVTLSAAGPVAAAAAAWGPSIGLRLGARCILD